MDQLRAMRVFSRVLSEGSLAAAARALDMTPPVVTRLLAELEAHLGSRLLHRTTRRITLTAAGQAYLERTRRILAELDDADAQAGLSVARPRGILRVLSPPAFAVHQLAPLLPRFHADYPLLSLEMSMAGPVEQADANFDVSIVSIGQQALYGDFVARPLARSHFVMCAAKSYLQRRGRPSDPNELPQHEGLLPAVAALRHELRLHRHASAQTDNTGDTLRVLSLPAQSAALASGHIDMLLAAAIAGLGIAGLPSFACAAALRDGRLERVLPDWHGGALSLYAAMPTRRQVPARTRVFIDFLVAQFGGCDADPWLDGEPA